MQQDNVTEQKNLIQIGVPGELHPRERRVAVVPELISSYADSGFQLSIEAGAGRQADFSDEEYKSKGANIVSTRDELFGACDIILQVRPLTGEPSTTSPDLQLLKKGQKIIGFFDPIRKTALIQEIASAGVVSLSIELMPRITKAQSMDALSSQATVAGYKAVLLAAGLSSKMFPLLMTAAGTVSPVHLLVIGAGVAGLQAIATAKRLGAVVSAYDVRPEVKEQVESLGAKFIELDIQDTDTDAGSGYAREMGKEFYERQRELMAGAVSKSDVVIATAAVPGKKAPVLIDEQMLKQMQFGSIIMDLAADSGGNCQLTRPGRTVEQHGVKIAGPLDVAATTPHHASQLYSRNLYNFVKHLSSNEPVNPDNEDEIIRGTLLTYDGNIVNQKVMEILNSKPTVA